MIETMRLEVPQDILAALKVGIQDFAQHMRIAAAVDYFEEKKLSLGKAAQLAGCNWLDFLDLLAEKGIAVFDYDESFADIELQGDGILAELNFGTAKYCYRA